MNRDALQRKKAWILTQQRDYGKSLASSKGQEDELRDDAEPQNSGTISQRPKSKYSTTQSRRQSHRLTNLSKIKKPTLYYEGDTDVELDEEYESDVVDKQRSSKTSVTVLKDSQPVVSITSRGLSVDAMRAIHSTRRPVVAAQSSVGRTEGFVDSGKRLLDELDKEITILHIIATFEQDYDMVYEAYYKLQDSRSRHESLEQLKKVDAALKGVLANKSREQRFDKNLRVIKELKEQYA